MVKTRLSLLLILLIILIFELFILLPDKFDLNDFTGFSVKDKDSANLLEYLESNNSANGFFGVVLTENSNFKDTYLVFKDNGSSKFENYLKIEVVAKTGNLSDNGVLVYKRDEKNFNFFELRFNADGALSFLVGDMDYISTIETLKTFNDNNFYEIDVILTKKNAFIFVDGVLEAQINDIYRIKNFYNSGNLAVGANTQDVDSGREPYSPFIGEIKLVEVYYN